MNAFISGGVGVGTATGTATTTYVHTDHLNSTALMTNASGTVVQTLDYLPYGAQRISQSTNQADAKRRFIGEMTDASGLSYLNARYYDSARGQFTKQDPVFWEVGQTKDGKSALSNPQATNSYGYGSGNPIINKDPTGQYAELSISGTYLGWSGAAGLRFDLQGMNAFISGGVGVGAAGVPVSIGYTPGPIPHTTTITNVVGASGAYGIGASVEQSGDYDTRKIKLTNTSTQISINVGLGADAYIRRELSVPVIGADAPKGLSLLPGSSNSTPNYAISFTTPLLQTPKPAVFQRIFTTPSGAQVTLDGKVIAAPNKK